jgi:hypothetical protein
MARLTITTTFVDNQGRNVTQTEHRSSTYVQARTLIARYVADNGLHRDTYGDSAPLFRDGVRVGHYVITR